MPGIGMAVHDWIRIPFSAISDLHGPCRLICTLCVRVAQLVQDCCAICASGRPYVDAPIYARFFLKNSIVRPQASSAASLL